MININSNKKLEVYINNEFNKIRKVNLNKLTSKYFGEIGSTSCEDISYNKQLEVKVSALKNIFNDLYNCESYSIIPSPRILNYRFKMDFVCSYDPFHEPKSRFGQRKKGKFNWVVDMDECNLIDKKWFKKIRNIYNKSQELNLRNYDLIAHDGELRYLVSKIYTEQAMLIIITKTSDNSVTLDKLGEEALLLGFESVYWLQQKSEGDLSTGIVIKYWGKESIRIPLKINNKINYFNIKPNTFFQNNLELFKLLLSKVSNYLDTIPHKELLIDLYCGVGTIGISLAHQVKHVLGIDIVGESIELAKKNAELNAVNNFSFQQADINNKDLTSLNIKDGIIIVDPPRIGLEVKGVINLLKMDPKYIVYISCNPITQYNDLIQIIKEGYAIELLEGYDMFPQTNHIENLAILKKN